nr:MAG TPA: hypothetical protein [Bacteriophage sp.]
MKRLLEDCYLVMPCQICYRKGFLSSTSYGFP